jgi:hypothetical protein
MDVKNLFSLFEVVRTTKVSCTILTRPNRKDQSPGGVGALTLLKGSLIRTSDFNYLRLYSAREKLRTLASSSSFHFCATCCDDVPPQTRTGMEGRMPAGGNSVSLLSLNGIM